MSSEARCIFYLKAAGNLSSLREVEDRLFIYRDASGRCGGFRAGSLPAPFA
jgi:hypothetical protein